jgi:hypothetical protein
MSEVHRIAGDDHPAGGHFDPYLLGGQVGLALCRAAHDVRHLPKPRVL